MAKFLKRWTPVFLWMAVIFFLSSQPIIRASSVDPLDFVVKKTAHIIEYAVLFVLLSRALQGKYKKAFLIGAFYAFTDETHQLFTPGRGGSLRDVLLFDITGLSLAWFLLHKNHKLLKWIK